jgi:HK97 gp10 family phage protein
MAKKPIEIIGGLELEKLLDQIPVELNAKALRAINRSGALVYRDAIKAKTPVGQDDIYNAVKIQNDRDDPTGLHVGITNKAFWARFIEFGTKLRRTSGSGKIQKKSGKRGSITADPFVGDAITAATPKAIDAIFTNAGQKLYNFLKRETRKASK